MPPGKKTTQLASLWQSISIQPTSWFYLYPKGPIRTPTPVEEWTVKEWKPLATGQNGCRMGFASQIVNPYASGKAWVTETRGIFQLPMAKS